MFSNKEAEHLHQQALMRIAMEGVVRQADAHAKVVSDLVSAVTENTRLFQEWISLFKGSSEGAVSHTIRDEDEVAAELERLPPELRLAYTLHQQDS
jgi:hypothetical protein